MNAQYHVLSGRRIVATRSGPCAREVALDYVRSMGCKRDDIIYYGVDGVAARRRVSGPARAPPRRRGCVVSET